MITVTNSSMKRFRDCQRRYWFEYVLKLRPAIPSRALRFGDAMHQLFDGVPRDEAIAALDDFDRQAVLALFSAYRPDPNIDASIEREYVFDIPAKFVRGVRRLGKFDAIVRLTDGRLALYELKTSGDAVDDELYWRRLLCDPQIAGYTIAARKLGWNVETVIYDVIRKPTISPAKATPIESRKFTKEGKLYANQRELDETPEQWGERLAADIASRPEFYFARRELPQMDYLLNEYDYETAITIKAIRQAMKLNEFVRNVGRQCDGCPFAMQCLGLVAWEPGEVPEGFVRTDNPHPELEVDRVQDAD